MFVTTSPSLSWTTYAKTPHATTPARRPTNALNRHDQFVSGRSSTRSVSVNASMLLPPRGQVPHARFRAELRLEPEPGPLRERLRERQRLDAVRDGVLPQVAEVDRAVPHLLRARRDARGQLPLLRPVRTEHAFLDRSLAVWPRLLDRVRVGHLCGGVCGLPPVERARAVRARRHAVPAADAPVVVDEHDPVVPPERRADRADLQARGILALHTRAGEEVLRPELVLDLEDRDPLLALRDEVRIAAPDRALPAPVALREVDQHDPLGVRPGDRAGVEGRRADNLENLVREQDAEGACGQPGGRDLQEPPSSRVEVRQLVLLGIRHVSYPLGRLVHCREYSQYGAPWPMHASRRVVTPDPSASATPSWNPTSRWSQTRSGNFTASSWKGHVNAR